MPALASIPPLPTASQRARWNADARRAILRVMRHEAADTLHPDALPEAVRQCNQLADANQDLAATIVLHSPDPHTSTRLERLLADSTPDEAASVLSMMFDRLVEPHELGVLTPLEPLGIGGVA